MVEWGGGDRGVLTLIVEKNDKDNDLNVIYHLLHSMNTFVTNKSKLPQDGAQVFPYMR